MGIQPATAINKNRNGSRTLGISIAHYYEFRATDGSPCRSKADPVFGPYDRDLGRRSRVRRPGRSTMLTGCLKTLASLVLLNELEPQ
jgi:hypothetical protein